ncbi:MAG: 16S rRNA (guanine(527)-N(7))-methyltransferase RsmG [Alphaproteobacteria bacterium]|nr:16S rRNA (guanine(527)-N(7))-methyltransferase RsmG [Alphaproteobacteria bacterium]
MTDRSRLLQVHEDLLERWRERMNLVGPGPVQVHYDDARHALEGLAPTGHWADLGSGAGFPGIVFAAMFPDVTIDLVDSRQKRCVFLEEVVAQAQAPGIQVRCARIETLPDEAYDGIVARALAPPEEVLAMGTRLLRPGGRLVLFLQGHLDPPRAPDYRLDRVTPYTVDGKARQSAFLTWRPPTAQVGPERAVP